MMRRLLVRGFSVNARFGVQVPLQTRSFCRTSNNEELERYLKSKRLMKQYYVQKLFVPETKQEDLGLPPALPELPIEQLRAVIAKIIDSKDGLTTSEVRQMVNKDAETNGFEVTAFKLKRELNKMRREKLLKLVPAEPNYKYIINNERRTKTL